MKDELITYETAILAKEVGFDVGCITYFRREQPNRKGLTIAIETYSENLRTNSHLSKIDKNYCTAPTQSLLQRWLREEKNLWVEVTVWVTHINVLVKELKNGEVYQRREPIVRIFNTYEQALEAGLFNALELCR